MARKTKRVVIDAAGRDNGKVFLVTEFAPRVGHAWATRALFAVANAGLDLGEDVMNGGFAGIAQAGVKALAKIPADVGEPLLAQLFDAVQVVPDPTRPDVMRARVESDIEEVATMFLLQKEVLALHIDFFTIASPSTSA